MSIHMLDVNTIDLCGSKRYTITRIPNSQGKAPVDRYTMVTHYDSIQ